MKKITGLKSGEMLWSNKLHGDEAKVRKYNKDAFAVIKDKNGEI